MLAEVVGGIAAHSLALLADAGHMLSDVAALEALSAHVVPTTGEVEVGALLRRLRAELHEHFGIDHVTVQVEPEPCSAGGRGDC